MKVYSQQESRCKIGEKFGILKVIGHEFSIRRNTGGTRRMIVCGCKCGEIKCMAVGSLFNGSTMSCGCIQKAIRGKSSVTHGMRSHPLYRIWAAMKHRCYHPKASSWNAYGKRGVLVCDEWLNNVRSFISWALTHNWRPGLEIDRKNNDGHYTPTNCRFVSRLVNANNRSSNIFLSAFDETKTIAQWARDKKCQVSEKTLRARVTIYGWNPERAITKPAGKYVRRNNNKKLSKPQKTSG